MNENSIQPLGQTETVLAPLLPLLLGVQVGGGCCALRLTCTRFVQAQQVLVSFQHTHMTGIHTPSTAPVMPEATGTAEAIYRVSKLINS